MRSASFSLLFAVAAILPAQEGQGPAGRGQETSVAELVSMIKAREKTVGSVLMEMKTRGTYPDGVTYEVEGRVRVLGETHFQFVQSSTFEEDLRSEGETVRTPDGAWMLERDPTFGEVYLHMTPDLLTRLEEAQKLISGEPGGAFDNPAKDPMGSALLESLDQQFDLQVARRLIDGREFVVVQGKARDGMAPPPEMGDLPMPDRVELLMRTPDLAVVEWTQFVDGKPVMQTEITRLELDLPMDEDSFELELPPGKEFIDVMDHPPAEAQIRQLLEEAERRKDGEQGR